MNIVQKSTVLGLTIGVVVAGIMTWGIFANPPTVIKLANSGAAFVDGEAQPPPSEKFQKDVLDRLDRIEKLIQKAMEDTPPPETSADSKRADGSPEVLSAGLTKCMGCHTEKEAPKKGDRFVLFTGSKGNEFRDDFRRSELRMIEEKVKDGTMPKKGSGKTLTAGEKSAIIAEVSARRAELEK